MAPCLQLAFDWYLAAVFGLCSKPWQILSIRAVTGAVNVGSYVGNIVMGQMVDQASKSQGGYLSGRSDVLVAHK